MTEKEKILAGQSSSATTVMTVSFVNAVLLTLTQAISVIMGANIGTTSMANLAALNANTQARRTAMAHLVARAGFGYSFRE